MSEALRQHLLMPVPPPRLLVKNPEPRVLVPNVHLANDRRVTPICIDPDVVVDDISKAEAVMKIQRRRAQQRIRSQRYREKKRMGGLKLDAVGFSLNAPSIPSPSAPNKETRPVLRAELQKGHLKQKPIGTIVPLQHKSVEGKTSPSRYTQRYYSSSGMSTFEPGLPKKTKSMMRANGLVVSYEWRTDSSGRKYLAGSRLIQVNPKPALHNKAIRASQGISYFSMKVEPSDDLAGVRTSDTDWQCLPLQNDWSQDVEIVPVKTENPEETDEQPSTRLQRPALAGDRKQSLRKEVQTLTYCRYCLYRRLVLRTKSLHTVYLAATKKIKNSQTGHRAQTKSPQPLLNKQSNVTKESVKINQACSIALFKVRNSLKRKVLKRIPNKSVNEESVCQDLSIDVISSNTDPEVEVLHMCTEKRPLSISSDSEGEVAAHRRKSARLGSRNRKMLKVKRDRVKAREVREACGYDVDEEGEEQRKRSSRIRRRRYDFLRSTKQSASLRKEPSGECDENQEGSSPRIVSIESVSGSHAHALSWEVVEDDLFPVKDEPDDQ